MLKIRLFGYMAVVQNEKMVAFPTEQTRALLAYLVMERQRPFPRSQLAAFLWPELPTKRVFRNFRQTLLRLRRALNDSNASEMPIILADRLTVQFNPVYPIELDVERFQRAMQLEKTGRKQGGNGRREIRLLEKATAVYQGNFLADVQCRSDLFDEWRVMEQERLLLQALAACERLATHYERNGRYEEMAAAARRQIELEAWREEAYQQLMQALWAMGKRTAALAQYEKLAAVLQEELAIAPDEEVVRLRDRIEIKKRPETIVDVLSGSLPPENAPFFGRQQEIESLLPLALEEDERLITLIGDGGVGKSRLATAVARQLMPYFPDGVWFVPLAGIRGQNQGEQEAVALHIAQTIGMPFQGTETAVEQLIAYLQKRELLLILDNVEQLGDGVNLVPVLLREAPAVALLCTSRQPLYLQAEYRFRLEGLPLPAEDEGATAVFQSAAVRLFRERARRVGQVLSAADAGTILTLCRLVDGLPLAIELMATALDRRTLAATAVAVQENYDTLATQMRDTPSRHRSLRAAFNTSWTLLTPAEQAIFIQLSIFRGAFTADAARQICAAAPAELNKLAEKSLLQRLDDDSYVLHERLRQYAHERLQTYPQQLQQTIAAHAVFYLEYVAANGRLIIRPGGLRIIRQLARSIDNVRAAWETAVRQARYDLIRPAVRGLFYYFSFNDQYQEVVRLYEQTSSQFMENAPANPDGRCVIGWMSCYRGFSLSQLARYDEAERLLHEADAIAQEVDDPELAMNVAFYSGDFYYIRGDYAAAEAQFERTLALGIRLESALTIAFAYNYKGAIAIAHSDLEQADNYLTLALSMAREHELRYVQIHILLWMGVVKQSQSRWNEAGDCYEEAIKIAREFEDKVLENAAAMELSRLYRNLGDFERALDYINMALRYYVNSRDIRLLGLSYERRGTIYHMMGDYTTALLDFEEALPLSVGQNDPVLNECDPLLHMARCCLQLGDYARAADLMARAEQAAQAMESERHLAEVAIERGCLALRMGQTAVADHYLQMAAPDVKKVDHRSLTARFVHEQAQLLLAQERWQEAEHQFLTAKALNAALEGLATSIEDAAGMLQAALAKKERETAVGYLDDLLTMLEKEPGVSKGQRGLWSRHVAHRALTAAEDVWAVSFDQETAAIIEEGRH